MDVSTVGRSAASRIIAVASLGFSGAYVAANATAAALSTHIDAFEDPVPYGAVAWMTLSLAAAIYAWKGQPIARDVTATTNFGLSAKKRLDAPWVGLALLSGLAGFICFVLGVTGAISAGAIIPGAAGMFAAGAVLTATCSFAMRQTCAHSKCANSADSGTIETDRRETFAIVATSVVATLALVSTALNGMPGKRERLGDDVTRLAMLAAVEQSANATYAATGDLPTQVDDFGLMLDYDLLDVRPYERTSTTTYRLCARFDTYFDAATARELALASGAGAGEYADVAVARLAVRWSHDAGAACFERTVDAAGEVADL